MRKYMENKQNESEIFSSNKLTNFDSGDEISFGAITFNEKTDNFIKSLAGYCVVTCVLGVANRITKNLLIKNNGIFLHVDFFNG